MTPGEVIQQYRDRIARRALLMASKNGQVAEELAALDVALQVIRDATPPPPPDPPIEEPPIEEPIP